MHKSRYALLLLCLSGSVAFADGRLLSWGTNDIVGVTQDSWNAAKVRSVKSILNANPKVRSWPDAYLLPVGANERKNDKRLLAGLVDQITDSTEYRLKDTSRLIIWERIVSGEIVFEGKGLQVDDDLFTVAGRANWMLRNITGKDLGHVKPNATEAGLTALQRKWQRWLAGESVAVYESPYPSREEGLEELRSLAAIEALIISLRPTPEKARITGHCLRTVYRLDQMPDPPGLAGMCDPDTYTHSYLAKITDVDESLTPDEWAEWWAEYHDKLEWDVERSLFRVQPE